MISLLAKIRKDFGKKTKAIKNEGQIPAIVYGRGLKSALIQVDEKEFRKVFKEVGESSLVELGVEGEKTKKLVLVHEIQKDPVSDRIIHVDFFQPSLTEKVQVAVPLIFVGESPAEKDLGGTLNKNILEIEIKALPQNLPHEIRVDINVLKTFEDRILVKDLVVSPSAEILKEENEVVAAVLPPQKVEEDLAVPIEEKVEEVEKVEKPKKEEGVGGEENKE